jgi:hypothetical protein
MKHLHTPTLQSLSRRRWTVSLVALVGACLALLPSGLSAHDLTLPPVPRELKVPAGHRPFLLGHASGTQNYICLPKKADPGFAWTLFGPQATLFNDDGMQIITHFLSPNPKEGGMARATWQHSRDTSTVWAKRIASSSDPTVVEPEAIPWLLLEVVGEDVGPTGGHRLTETTYIQRVHTSGGLEPPTDCAQGQQALVPYTADYIFFKATGRE